MLAAKVLNSSASLNDFDEIGALDFIAGEATTLALRLFQPQREDELRYVAADGATMNVVLTNKDGSTLTKAASLIDAGDRSLWSVALSTSETENLAGGNFTFELTEGANLQKGWVENGMSLLITGGSC